MRVLRKDNRVFRVATGLDGQFGKGWSWKVYGTFGRDWYDTVLGNNIVVSNLAAATDVVINPLTGQPDCRQNVAGAAAAGELAYGAAAFCVPANPFGPDSLASAKDYIVDDLHQNSVYTQVAAGSSINGEPFSTWAGPVSFAAGIDYRYEKVTQDVSFYADFVNPPLFASGGFQQSNPKSFAGNYTVVEGFSEVVVPLLADMKGAEALDLNGAIRVTDYSTSGTVVTWKIGTTYQPIPGFRFRAAYRLAPAARFPAASEDVAAVYSALLKGTPGDRIGLYGCSAGGLLTAQSLVWFQTHDLPVPAAAGIFCAGGDASMGGDSRYTGLVLGDGEAPRTGPASVPVVGYMAGAVRDDGNAFPAGNASLLGHFPPTLIVTGTRDFAMSSAVNLHSRLVAAGVDARLHVWEGGRHAFFYDVRVPEAHEVFEVVAKFFSERLK